MIRNICLNGLNNGTPSGLKTYCYLIYYNNNIPSGFLPPQQPSPPLFCIYSILNP
jgi:hypothetical protein